MAEKFDACLSDNISRLTDTYRRLAITPIQTNAKLLKINGLWKLCVEYSSSDMDSGESDSFKKYFEIECSENKIRIGRQSDMCYASNDLLVSYSKTYEFRAIIKCGLKRKPYIEIWERGTKLKSLTSDVLDQYHGVICINKNLRSFEWSPDESCLIYTAEKKEIKSISFFNDSDDTKQCTQKGNEFVYKDHWGEGLADISHTYICILNVQQNYKIQVVEMKDYSLAQAFWINEHRIGFVAWKETPFRVGLNYSSDRQSFVYFVDLSDPKLEPKLLYGSDAQECIRFPRMSPQGDYFIFLSNPLLYNCEASKLMKYSLSNQQSEVVIDVASDDSFFKPIYTLNGFAMNCFIDNRTIILDCVRSCQNVLLQVDLITKQCQELRFPLSSAFVLDIKDNMFVMLSSAPNAYPTVYIAKLKSTDKELQYIKVDETLEENILDISFNCDEIKTKDENNLMLTLHTIFVSANKQKQNSLQPTIVIGHGGPHHSFVQNYSFLSHFFAEIGFNQLLVNYRGSTGLDEEHIRSIRGSIGDGDIRDYITCIDYHHKQGTINKDKLLLLGGSHSGFQSLHLCGQYPNFGFKACAVLNPVVDVSTIIESTDTPDWGWIKCFDEQQAYSFTNIANSEILQTMFNKSPIKYVNNHCIPTLFLLGKYDRRCPMNQSLKYYKALKARKVDTKCFVYDDNHILDKVNVKSDVLINTAIWFLRYIND